MKIAVVGGGLVGALLSVFLKKKGHEVNVFEKRKDPRTVHKTEGRSINLVLASRGLAALDQVGLKEAMLELSVPLYGRMLHDKSGKTTFLQYGKDGQAIHSISRKQLNEKLLSSAETEGVSVHFEQDISEIPSEYDFIFGADGLGSEVRHSMVQKGVVNEKLTALAHGYKELTIPSKNGEWVLDKNALHIWPREQFMLIALPNVDGSFTCTLFLQMEGETSFESLGDYHAFQAFIQREFPDVLPYLTELENDYYQNPVSRLVYLDCWPWVNGNTALIGDAAHAIVPFYGQGMNAGFEDCHTLDQLLDKHEFDVALREYQQLRKPNADAIKELSLQNFVEMRDKVADKEFQKGKNLTAQFAELYPDQWIPQYSQVTFTTIPYVKAKESGEAQWEFIEGIISMSEYHEDWLNDPKLKKIVLDKLEAFFKN